MWAVEKKKCCDHGTRENEARADEMFHFNSVVGEIDRMEYGCGEKCGALLLFRSHRISFKEMR